MADFLTAIGTSLQAAYALVKLRTAYAGSGIRVRRSSDNAEQDIGFDANNELDWPAAISFAGGSNLFLRTFYDQSGNGINVGQSNTSFQFAVDTTNKRLTGSGGAHFMSSSSNIGISGDAAFTVFSFFGESDSNRDVLHFGGSTALTGFRQGRTAYLRTGFSDYNSNYVEWQTSPDPATRARWTVRKAAGAFVANTSVWRDGVSVSAGTSGGDGTPNITNGLVTIGANGYNGTLDYIIVVASALGTTEREAGQDWLADEGWLPNPPVITTTTLPDGVQDVEYIQSLAVTGGFGSITWSLDSGTLPPGLTIPSSGSGSWGTPTTAALGTYNFVVKATDSAAAFDTQALSITITEAPSSKWTRGSFVPRGGLIAWWDALVAPSGGSAPDLTGSGYDLAEATNPPTLVADAVNGNPWFYFDGTNDYLTNGTINLANIKHAFIVAALDRATFTGAESIMHGGQPTPLLPGTAGDTKFDSTSVSSYKKNGVSYELSDMQAPVNNELSIIEVVFTATGISLDGPVDMGRNEDSGHYWKGPIAEILLFEEELSERMQSIVYKYLAMKYLLFKQDSTGRDYFPFVQDWASPTPVAKRVLADEAEDNSTMVYRTKQSKKKIFDLSFTRRLMEEIQCAEAFYDAKHPGTEFVFEDRSYYPPVDTVVRFEPDAEFEPTPFGPSNWVYKLRFKEK